MRNGQKERTRTIIRAAGLILTLSLVLGLFSGCKEKQTPVVIGSSPANTEPAPTETATPEFDPDKPVSIGETAETSVPFGRLTENVGYLNIGLTEKDFPAYVLKGQYIYCLSGAGGKYTFRKINIENLERSEIREISVNGGTATLLDFGLRCDVNNESVFYDFSFHEICRMRGASDEQKLVPYKDGYLVKEGALLKILHLDDDQPYRKLDSSDYVITGYHSTGDNTYLIMKNSKGTDAATCTIYDVNRKTYFKRVTDNVVLCDNGMIRRSAGKYHVTNFANKKTDSYKSNNPGKIGSSLFDGTRQFYFDQADRKIKYYVPSKQQICVLSDAEFVIGAELKGLYGSYVYAQYGGVLYFIDSAGQKEQPASKYANKIKKEAAELKKNLEFHYRIKILSGKDAVKAASKEAKLVAVTSDLETLTAMKDLSPALKKFSYKFFDEFKWNKKDGINILLSGNIAMEERGGMEGASFTGKNAYYIALDIHSGNMAMTLLREIMHTIEHRMVNSEQIFKDWERYNPEGFSYSELSAGAADAPYVPENESDPAKVYFTDSYACASPYEDRARIFACMFLPEKYGRNLSDYPCLMSKAAGLKHVLLVYYPSLSESAVLKDIR